MNQPENFDPIPDLPAELAELDQELAGIRLAERPSFAPELEAELGREWLVGARRGRGPALVRGLLAASITAIVFAGLAVPPARASLVTRLQQLWDVIQQPDPAEQATPAPPSEESRPPLAAAEPDADDAVDDAAPRLRTEARRSTRSEGEPLRDFPAFTASESTYPTLVDLESDRILMRRYYPPSLMRDGIGGTVGLLLWVDSTGAVDNVELADSSGVPALDRAALQAAPSLRFHPTSRNGRAVGSWVGFDLVFEPPHVDDPLAPLPFPVVPPIAEPAAGPGDWEAVRDWEESAVVPAPIRREAQELLRSAMGQPRADLERRFGSLDGVLAGDPPSGAAPLRWRSETADALESAMARDPDNPAPYLALARIRRKQGLREDARLILGTGVERAQRGIHPVSPRLEAELAYEYGRALTEAWLPWRAFGRLPAEALDGRVCARRAGPADYVDADLLIAWNYLCSIPLGVALREDFEPVPGGEDERAATLASFRDAVRAYPAHVGANVELLLDMADRGAWTTLLNASNRFARATQGHPYALLMNGVALHRLGRAEEALLQLRSGLDALDDEARAGFEDVRLLEDQGSDPETFWKALDPLLITSVNEREVEHFARAAYAFLRFGDLETDPARVWLRYGRPLRTWSFGGDDLRTEFWDYGEGPDVTLTRPARSEEYRLTSEARAYLEDLARVFPHGYEGGAPNRILAALPAQIVRHRGPEDSWVEVEVALSVPEVLRAGAAPGDSLELGLFVSTDDGSRLADVRDRVAVNSGVVQWRLPAGPDAAQITVELYNPRNHRGAGVRADLRDDDMPGGRASDLALVRESSDGEGEYRRPDVHMTPLGRGDRLDGDEVSVALELYELGPAAGTAQAAEPYRVRAELEATASGNVSALPIRPRGESEFRSSWSQTYAAGVVAGDTEPVGRELAVLTLDLRPVPPGTYTLRVVVDLPDGGRIVRELTGLRRFSPARDIDGDAALEAGR